MTRKQALLNSVKRWERISFDGESSSKGNCDLCDIAQNGCKTNCIIGIVTQKGICCDTPHDDYSWDNADSAVPFYLFLCMLYHEYYG